MNYNFQKMSSKEILYLIKCSNICIIGVSENNKPYLLPVVYESEYRDRTLVITVRSKSYGMKIRYISNNDSVCLYFERRKGCILETVVAFGTAFIDKSNKDNEESEINIVVNSISGRKYSFK